MQSLESDATAKHGTVQAPYVEVTVKLPPGLASFLSTYAEKNGLTLSDHVRDIVVHEQFDWMSQVDGVDILSSIFPGIWEEFKTWYAKEYPPQESDQK